MLITAKLRYLRIAPRKVRMVVDLIRGKSVEEAQTILAFVVKNAAAPLLKLLNSAVANAKNNFQIDSSNLYIAKITVDEGQKYKRWRPRARGQAYEIQKKTSHITLVLGQLAGKVKRIQRAKEVKAVERIGEAKEMLKPAKSPQLKPRPEKELPKPGIKKSIKRIFRRKAF